MKQVFSTLGILFVMACFGACTKEPVIQPPTPELYTLKIDNQFNNVEARLGLFLSDKEGVVRAFRWLNGGDTAQIRVPGSVIGDRFDGTIVKITNSETPGTGIRDTSVELTTYPQLTHNQTIILRNLSFQQSIRLKVTFEGVTSVDSVIVPDGLTFARPQPGNNFTGEYLTFHSGQLWIRVLLNGEALWRFIYFERADGPTLITTLQSGLMPPIIAKPIKVKLPFPASWSYKVDGVIDTATRRFVPIGDLLRAPGGFVPTIDRLDVFEPNSGDPQVPTPLPYNKGYRVRLESINGIGSGYKYYTDRFYNRLPAEITSPSFSIAPTVLADTRSVGVICTPGFDVLSITRSRTGATRYSWEAFAVPANGSLVHRLPNVPEELAALYPVLKAYQFDKGIRVRAESYDRITTFEAAMKARMLHHDVLWQAKAGYVGVEAVY